MIGYSPPEAAATVTTLRTLGIRVKDVPTAAIEVVATILVMGVSAAAVPGIAGWRWDHRRFPREVSVIAMHDRGLAATRTSLNAHCVVRINDVVGPHRATGQPNFRLNALAVQPRWQVEHYGVTPSLSRNRPFLLPGS
jgi:hypothetical protein